MSILALGRKQKKRKIPNQRVGESKKKERKFPIKEWEKAKKKERKFPIKEWEKAKKKESSRSKIRRKQKKYAERSLDQTISEQYKIVTK